jgi:hypothetical protein
MRESVPVSKIKINMVRKIVGNRVFFIQFIVIVITGQIEEDMSSPNCMIDFIKHLWVCFYVAQIRQTEALLLLKEFAPSIHHPRLLA